MTFDGNVLPRAYVAHLMGLGVFLPAALLFVPVLYYSLTTPFALIDDYVHSTLSSRLDSAASFFAWFNMQFCDLGAAAARYRPYWELYNCRHVEGARGERRSAPLGTVGAPLWCCLPLCGHLALFLPACIPVRLDLPSTTRRTHGISLGVLSQFSGFPSRPTGSSHGIFPRTM